MLCQIKFFANISKTFILDLNEMLCGAQNGSQTAPENDDWNDVTLEMRAEKGLML